jgi:hypothetical protein
MNRTVAASSRPPPTLLPERPTAAPDPDPTLHRIHERRHRCQTLR